MPENELITTPSFSGGLVQPQVQGQLTTETQDTRYTVILVRPGVGARKFAVPVGSTVGDLCHKADANISGQEVMIGNTKVDANRVLQANDVLFVVPKPKNA